MGVGGGGGEHPRCVGIGPHAPHARARTRTERDALLNRGAADPGQGRRFFNHGIPGRGRHRWDRGRDLEQMLHPRGNPLEHDADFVIERVPLVGSVEDAIEEQGVRRQSAG